MEIFRVDVSVSLGVAGVPPQHLLLRYHHLPGVDHNHVVTHILVGLSLLRGGGEGLLPHATESKILEIYGGTGF